MPKVLKVVKTANLTLHVVVTYRQRGPLKDTHVAPLQDIHGGQRGVRGWKVRTTNLETLCLHILYFGNRTLTSQFMATQGWQPTVRELTVWRTTHSTMEAYSLGAYSLGRCSITLRILGLGNHSIDPGGLKSGDLQGWGTTHSPPRSFSVEAYSQLDRSVD